MLAGFLGAFTGARAIVHWIFSHHEEKKFFNLHYVEGFENPIHPPSTTSTTGSRS